MFYQTNRLFKVASSEYPVHLNKMIKACLMADNIVLPERPTGKLKALYQNLAQTIIQLSKNPLTSPIDYITSMINSFGDGKRLGDQHFINHAGCKSPVGKDLDWFLKAWADRAIRTMASTDNDPTSLLFDLEIIAPANSLNSTIAQITWSGIRLTLGKPLAYIPIGEIITYRGFIKAHREQHETHYNFQQAF